MLNGLLIKLGPSHENVPLWIQFQSKTDQGLCVFEFISTHSYNTQINVLTVVRMLFQPSRTIELRPAYQLNPHLNPLKEHAATKSRILLKTIIAISTDRNVELLKLPVPVLFRITATHREIVLSNVVPAILTRFTSRITRIIPRRVCSWVLLIRCVYSHGGRTTSMV